MRLTAAQVDRAHGVLVTTAAGDALGAGYEFQPARRPELPVAMVGGGPFGWEPGEWTDDTSMAIAIAEVAATGADLRDETAQDAVVIRWVDWASTAKDVGNQTRAVLSAVDPKRAAASAREYARRQFAAGARSAGNGTLMRTAPVALACLDDEDALAEAAAAISNLTHGDRECAEACILWCCAIRHAVLTGERDVRRGLERLAPDRRVVWDERLDEAERSRPRDFPRNGWVVQALQAAWCAIAITPVPDHDSAHRRNRADHLSLALEAAVRAGNDTDTVAAIAGGLLGALHGASAVPATWRDMLHGWPGMHVPDLLQLTDRILRLDAPSR